VGGKQALPLRPGRARRHLQDEILENAFALRYSGGNNKRKGATGFDGDHEARVACRAPGTRKSPETTKANEQLALAA
jgi:hypothetical protein